MGSYIGIGLVYNNTPENRVEKELKNVVNYLISQDGCIKSVKFSKDEDGNEWVESSLKNNLDIENFYLPLVNGYFGQLQLICDIFNVQKLNVYIRIEKVDKTYFGLLLDIDEEELIGVSSSENINKATEMIIEFLNVLHETTGFEYAFCDNEAEIQYSPTEFQLLNEEVYSVVALPVVEDKIRIKIVKSGWHIDGLTTRTI